MALAYSYIRFSSPEQLKGDSLRRQLALSESWSSQHKIPLDTSLTLHDLGLSAFHGKNLEKGALGAFINAIDQGKVKPGSYLLVESLDRISRAEVMVALELFISILNKGITIVTLGDGQSYSKAAVKDNWSSLIISIAVMARAHEESATKSKRLKAAWDNKIHDARESGKKITKACPSWLKLSSDRTKFELIPEAVAVVKRIYTMAQQGHGPHLIEKTLNTEKVPSIGRTSGWHRSYIHKTLRARTVIGEYQHQVGKGKARRNEGEPIKDYYPAIISEEQFYAVQQLQDAKKSAAAGRKGTAVANLLSGLCKCGYCHSSMQYVNKGERSKPYLVCSKAKRGLGCRHLPWTYSDIESDLLNYVTELKLVDLASGEESALAQQLAATAGKVSELEKAQANIMMAIEQAPSVTMLVSRLVAIEKELAEVKASEKRLKRQTRLVDSLESRIRGLSELRTQLEQAEGKDLYELRLRISSELKQLIEKVEFLPAGTEMVLHTGLTKTGVLPADTVKSFAVHFRNGQVRFVKGGWTGKFNLKK